MDVVLTPLVGDDLTRKLVLVAVALLGGVFAGQARKGRWGLLLGGLLLILALGAVAVLAGERVELAEQVLRIYAVVIPLAVPFVAGFLASKGSWPWRAAVVVAAVVVLWLFPYPVVAAATADALFA